MTKKEIQKIIDQTYKEWEKENTPEAVATKMRSILEKQRDKVLYALMGFEYDSWHEWRIPTYGNGRQSEINKFISEQSKGESEKWIKENMGKLPKFTNEQTKAFRKFYEQELRSVVTNVLTMHAREEGIKIANETIAKMIDEKVKGTYE